ncbi:hypothetical protein F4677DRAFT_437502 [Hypoxylon crocopeplum]|nr:hypothetical protein F4677DRAFT_437502 [Hypoxylon crocopeplum]
MATPTPEQIKYMQDNIDESLVPAVNISSGVLIGAATIAVVLRFLARRMAGAGLGRDDYCLSLAYILFVCYATGLMVTTRYGEGRHVLLVTDPKGLAVSSMVAIVFYVLGMACVKYSILFLYRRIFPDKTFRTVLFIVAAIVTSWALACLFTSIFNCYPLAMAWDKSIEGLCIDYGEVTLILGICNVILDFVVLGAPMPSLWKLRMSIRRKVLLSLAFAAGSIACLVSIARLFYAKDVFVSFDPSWDNTLPGMLSGLEICTGVVACCTITYRPLVEKIFGSSEDASRATSDSHRWNKINVQHNVSVVGQSRAELWKREGNRESLQEWELRSRGIDGEWL